MVGLDHANSHTETHSFAASRPVGQPVSSFENLFVFGVVFAGGQRDAGPTVDATVPCKGRMSVFYFGKVRTVCARRMVRGNFRLFYPFNSYSTPASFCVKRFGPVFGAN